MAKSRSSRARGQAGTGLQSQASARSELENPSTSIAGTTAGHNSAKRAEIIRECKAEIDDATTEAAQLREKVNKQNKRVSNAYRRLKSELDMKRKDAEFHFRLVDLPDSERNEAVDHMREIFAATGKGEQLDWINASDKADERTAAQKEARAAGREAGRVAKLNLTDNPHPLNSAAFHEWNAGYGEGQKDNMEFGQADQQPAEVDA